MSALLAVLPLAAFVGLLWLLRPRAANPEGAVSGWRAAALQAAVLWGLALVVITEALSALRALTPSAVAAAWLLVLAASAGAALRRRDRSRGTRWPSLRGWGAIDLTLLALLAAEAVVLLAVALAAAPNNTDSLLYHLPRVAHWQQNRSLAHYASLTTHQLAFPYWAEGVILHLRLLSMSDGLANLVQWGAMAGALAAVSGCAGLLGVGRRGQLLAAAFAASVPMGVLQATSTQNDYVTGFWLVALAFLVLRERLQGASRGGPLWVGGALALGTLTKGTFPVLAAPLALYYLIGAGRAAPRSAWLRSVVAVGLIGLVVNAPHWLRNLATFGHPLGPPAALESLVSQRLGPLTFLANAAQGWAANFATPSETLNQAVASALGGPPSGADPDGEGFRLVFHWNHEDLAGSPLHLALGLGLPVVLLLGRRTPEGRASRWLYGLTLGAWALFAIVFRWNPFILRLQLPLHLLAAPLVAAAVARLGRPRLGAPAAALLLAAAGPWVLFNATRPVVAMQPDPQGLEIPCLAGCTAIGSVFEQSRTDQLFANFRPLQAPATATAALIEARSCARVGLMLGSYYPEYVYWWLLDTPRSGVRIDVLRPASGLEGLVRADEELCAILCTGCEGQTRVRGLEWVTDHQGVAVYLSPAGAP